MSERVTSERPHVGRSAGRSRLAIDAWSATHVGHQREQNEDAHRCTPARGVFIIADGIGGHPAGEVASSIAVETAHTELIRGAQVVPAFEAAQKAVLSSSKADRSRFGMGTTLVAAVFSSDWMEIGWCGDSRCYLYRSGVLMLLTRDMGHDGYLSHYIGQPEGTSIRTETCKLQIGDRVLLCSDGLSNYVDEEIIRQEIRDGKSPRHAVDALIAASLTAGGHDNVTISLVKVVR